jgi:large subunit ribosomal protein L18
LKKVANGKPRLSVFRSGKNIYAQIIDDKAGKTLVSASSLDKDLKLKSGSNKDAAIAVGKSIAEKANKAKVAEVVFDRGGVLFHGRIRALAESAREAGLKF